MRLFADQERNLRSGVRVKQIASLLHRAYNSRRCIGGLKHLSLVSCSSLRHADDEPGRPDPIASDMCRDGSIAVKYFGN
jgi:hypothetical protein